MSWKIEIEKVDNGFIVNVPEEHTDGKTTKIITRKSVKEFKEDVDFNNNDEDAGEKIAMTELFELMAEYFGIIHDKWGENNLNIKWDRKGHKVD